MRCLYGGLNVEPAGLQVQEGAQGAYQQVASAAPLQRVVEYGQAAAAKATEQAQAAYECAPPQGFG